MNNATETEMYAAARAALAKSSFAAKRPVAEADRLVTMYAKHVPGVSNASGRMW